MRIMRTIANAIWLVLFGLWFALIWWIVGFILCVTIIGIPFGFQCFKVAKLMLAPFGKTVITRFEAYPIANILWAIFFGWEMFIALIGSAVAMMVTIVGIPIGLQIIKMSILAIFPFGAQVH